VVVVVVFVLFNNTNKSREFRELSVV
jgi:hypothetical protein